jgi:hypothetical protein
MPATQGIDVCVAVGVKVGDGLGVEVRVTVGVAVRDGEDVFEGMTGAPQTGISSTAAQPQVLLEEAVTVPL